jgi:NAD(P)-dependent dehydrogenase (short-subunit alcohol dehydrogenase family)
MAVLDKCVAIVTGGGGALGREVVKTLLLEGAAVHVPYVAADEIGPLREHVGAQEERLTCVEADVLDETAVQRFVAGVQGERGRIDVLVNLVGGFWGGVPVTETPEESWDRMLRLNVNSVFLCCKAVVPLMRARRFGRVVNVSSKAGMHGVGNYAAYSVAKAAVITLTQALAEESRDDGVCVNAVAPSTIDTPANRQAMPDAEHQRWVSPADIARVILFLCSSDAAVTSGAVVPVYGGG